MTATYLGPAVGIYWKMFESYGIDPVPILKDIGIDPDDADDPNARFSYRMIDELWMRLVELSGDPCIGVKAANFWHPSHYGALGYAWLASGTLRTAMTRYQRYFRILTEGAWLELEDVDTGLKATLKYKAVSRKQPTRTDSFFSYTVEMCRANAGASFNPVSLSLMHPAPTSAGEFHAYFRCPIIFDADENSMIISKEDADRKLPSGNPHLARLSDQVMVEYLAIFDKADIISQTKAAIIDQLPSGGVTEVSVADALNISSRTLLRRLQDQETHFKSVLNEVRQELAIKYLKDNRQSLTEVSFLLGFSEVSAFSRAFKRWTGKSPSDYRKA